MRIFSPASVLNRTSESNSFEIIPRLIRKLGRVITNCFEAIKHRKKLAEYASYLPVLSKTDAAIVQSLLDEGVYVTSLEALGLDSNSELLEAADWVVSTLPDRPGKSGIDVHAKTADLLAQPALFDWGLQERLLDIVESYLGLPAVFNDIHCRRDFANSIQSGSRLWHVDSYDHRILRVFVYLNEVTETTGAFQYISRRSTRWLVSILEQFGKVPDWVIDLLIAPTQIKTCTGTKGTVVFAGTGSILHRGKLPTDGERLTLVFNYNTREVKKAEEAKTIVKPEQLSAIAQSCTPRQQRSLLWL